MKNMSDNINKVFLSHQKSDKEFVEGLGTALIQNGVDVFYDNWDIQGGDSIPKELEKGLLECNILLYILSPNSTGSKWVQGEYHAYLYRKINDHSLRIIPILLQDCQRPPFLAPLKYIDFRRYDQNDPSFFDIENDGPFQELIESIYRLKKKPKIGPIHHALASYEFYFQKCKKEDDTFQYYEFAFKNLTDSPLQNFLFTLYFEHPVEAVNYDFKRSSANFTGGDGLNDEKTRFNWLGNQIMEDNGWVVFIIKSKDVPIIERICTKYVGRIVGSNQVIPPDVRGI